MKNKKVWAFLFLFLLPPVCARAYWVWSPESGKFVNPQGSVEDSAEEQYEYAMKFYQEKNYKEAADQFQYLIKRFPQSEVAGEAYYRLGNIYEEQNDYQKAFGVYKKLIESYPQSKRLNEVVEREYRIGNLFLSGKKAKLMGLEVLPSLPRAIEIFQHIATQAPYSEYGDKAQFNLGLAYKKAGRFDEATAAFQAFVDRYSQSDLLSEARYQLAETSYLNSKTAYRDQRALDDASKEINRFLERYPDSSVSEKAARLRQNVDEKNAEKNYRIGVYYEKENYLQSALIYYSDVAQKYPHTKWGDKAARKLKEIEQPAAYLSEQETQVDAEIGALEKKMAESASADPIERDQLKRKIERLRAQRKSIGKDKTASLQRREGDIKRREQELRERAKKLKEKKKILAVNKSEDFGRAVERWESALDEERAKLDAERSQLAEWRQTLGVRERRLNVDFLPFVGARPSEIDQVRRVGAKKLYKVSEDKKTLLVEKEVLYKQHGEVKEVLEDLEERKTGLDLSKQEMAELVAAGGSELAAKKEALDRGADRIRELENQLEAKSDQYQKQYGKKDWLSWVQLPARAATASTAAVARSVDKSVSFLNPFDHARTDWSSKSPEELREIRMHLKEKIAAQEALERSLKEALGEEIAVQEEQKLLAALDSGKKEDPRQLRKSMKRLEKEIRRRYEEIEDRHDEKKRLLDELDGVLAQDRKEKNSLARGAHTVLTPVKGAYRLTKSFLVGMPPEGKELTDSASSRMLSPASAEKALKLKHEIELQNLLIESKSQELVGLHKELEILSAQASLEGGLKFRSAFVKVPYVFINEAIDNAKKLVPQKNRREILAERLSEETRELEELRAQMKTLDGLTGTEAQAQAAAPESEAGGETQAVPQAAAPAPAAPADPGEEALKQEIQAFQKELEGARERHSKEGALYEAELRALAREMPGRGSEMEKKLAQSEKRVSERSEKLRKELGEIEAELGKIIRKESGLEEEEAAVLEERIKKIDTLVPEIRSKTVKQDILKERVAHEQRLGELAERRGFLNQELERFEFTNPKAAQ